MDKHGGNIFNISNDVTDFSVSLSPNGIPEGVKKAIRDSLDSFDAYPDSNQGKLREAIANRYNVTKEKVACGNGAADLIYRLPLAVKRLNKGIKGRALILHPAFSCYEEALIEAGYDVNHHILLEEDSFVPRDGFIQEILLGDYDMVFVANPSNPVGTLMERDYLDRLINVCEEREAFLIIDECFLELTGRDSAIEETKDKDYLLVLRSFTKTYAMAGLRLGYLISGNKKFVEMIMDTGQPWPISNPAEAGGIAALQEKDYLHKVNDYLDYERKKMRAGLSSLGLKAFNPSANYVFFYGPKGLKEKLLEKGFLIRDCGNFIGLEEGYYRVGIRRAEDNEKLMEVLSEIL